MNRTLDLARSLEAGLVGYCQELIRVPSMPGEERELAERVAAEMRALDYHAVWIDEAGNVVGCLKGEDADAPSVMLLTHLDHVDPGDHSAWRHPPFSGALDGGRIYGRGAADIKGPLATHTYIASLLSRLGRKPQGDVYVTAVVMEEVGGLGMRHIMDKGKLRPHCVIVGEPSGNQLRLGHRGRVLCNVSFLGRATHASMPELAVNPLYGAAHFLSRLEAFSKNMHTHPELGSSTVAPTLMSADTTSANLIPGSCQVTLDWRTTGETREDVDRAVRNLLRDNPVPAEVEMPSFHRISYTGLDFGETAGTHSSFATAPGDPWVGRLNEAIDRTLGSPPDVGYWRFCTDGCFTHEAGIVTLGFGPSEEAQAHVVDESVSVTMMIENLACLATFLSAGE